MRPAHLMLLYFYFFHYHYRLRPQKIPQSHCLKSHILNLSSFVPTTFHYKVTPMIGLYFRQVCLIAHGKILFLCHTRLELVKYLNVKLKKKIQVKKTAIHLHFLVIPISPFLQMFAFVSLLHTIIMHTEVTPTNP